MACGAPWKNGNNRDAQEKGRFEPSSKEQWLNTFTIDTGGARPTLIEDITDDEARLTVPQNTPLKTRDVIKVAHAQTWFDTAAERRFSSELDTHFHGEVTTTSIV